MGSFGPNIDYRGARGSNTGDQFHELWALLQILDLLNPKTGLHAVSLEGVRAEESDADSATWDGVDCALYYGGSTVDRAERIEFAQLKYSGANPDADWSIARLTANSAKKSNNSVIRKMADDFRAARARMKEGAQLKLRLVSNQGLSADLKSALETRWSGALESAGLDQAAFDDLKRLLDASGLSAQEFSEFVPLLDFSECGRDSRFAVREKVVDAAARLLGDDVSSEVRALQVRAREAMLPERAREIITEKDVLLWFGLSGREGLFPCPPDIRVPIRSVPRHPADEVASQLLKGERLVVVHGEAGCGKTTLMRQIGDKLPAGSIVTLFDCFGGGRYIYSDDKRHLPENAFLHMANELAVVLGLPLFIPRSTQHPASIQSFMSKLRSAGEALQQLAPGSIVLVIVDAADNAVTAALTAKPAERPFVFDLFTANLRDLPGNVRIVASCRTGRRDSLNLPTNTREVVCPPFKKAETKTHLESAFGNSSDSLVEQFHSLSYANPRVQAYAIATAQGDGSRVLDALLPGGKTLPDVLRTSFEIALNKLGQPQIFEKLVGALAFLPAPVAISAIASVAECTEATVRDFALDLAPGLRLQRDAVTIADEDFDAFIKERASSARETTVANIARHFAATYPTDAYSSVHVAEALLSAGRARDLLSLVDNDPHVAAVGDPIVKRQTQVRRLKLSLAACREAGSTVDALKTVLISAEAERDESTLNDVLEKELDLSVEFGGPSLRRTILLDPDRVQKHGSFLAQDAVRAIRSGDPITAREQLHFYRAWLRRRREAPSNQAEDWSVTDEDIAARVETILELAGPQAAFDELMGWRPRSVSIRVAQELVPQLIAAGKSQEVRAFLTKCRPSPPWDLLVWVPLAMAGESVDSSAIEKSLRKIRKRFIPDPTLSDSHFGEGGWQRKLLNTFITACELAFKLQADHQVIVGTLNRILEVIEGKERRRLYTTDSHRVDSLLRCWLLKDFLLEAPVGEKQITDYIKTLNPDPKPESRPARKRGKKRAQPPRDDNREDERLLKKIRALLPVYLARLEILKGASEGNPAAAEQLARLGSLAGYAYDFDYDHNGMYFRETAARTVMDLLIVEGITASQLVSQASSLLQDRYSDALATRRQRVWSMMRFRTSEADKLEQLVGKMAEEIKGLRAASSDKLEAIVRLSRLILPVSRHSAESLFNSALTIAKEIDREAVDQIDFLSVLSERANIPDQNVRRLIASDISAFVSGAAERLSDHEGFPWHSGVQAMASMDDAIALSSIARWADDGTASIDRTFDRYILTVLQRGVIGPGAGAALCLLLRESDDAVRRELAHCSAKDPTRYANVIDELAKNVILVSPQSARLRLGQEITDQIPDDGLTNGPWMSRLKETVAFIKSLPEEEPKKEDVPQRTAPRQSDGDLPKEFSFDPQGQPFTTGASIAEVLRAAAASGLPHHDRELLRKMRDASASPRHRVDFLNALDAVPDDDIWSTDRVEMICETASAWKASPGVDAWIKDCLPQVIVRHFYGSTRWLKEGQSFLHKLLDLTGLNGDARLQVILGGVAGVGENLDSRTLFAIAEEISRALSPEQAGLILQWYAERVRNRLPAEDRTPLPSNEIPMTTTEAIARFLFAMMSDIDTRIRWRAAHALRGLARLGCFELVKATLSQSNRVKDPAFRDPSAPYYFLAAKLWLALAAYRISAETPNALGSCKKQLLDLTLSRDLPHVGIREYGKRALVQLASVKAITLTKAETDRLNKTNSALKGKVAEKRASFRSFNEVRESNRRFKFDETDTIAYWYEDILRIFPTASQQQILKAAERWIVDKWGVPSEANWWDKEPRKARYDERRFGLWSHRHGSLPTVERYGTHVEWHAMHCVIGELLATHPIAKSEYHFDSFEYWLSRLLPTEAPGWLSDNRGSTPLEARLWTVDPRTDNGWLHHTRTNEFLAEIGSGDRARQDWIVVEGHYTTHSARREANVRVSSALVSPATGRSLARALQTASNPWDFRIPDEDDDLQIDVPPYRLTGWLAAAEGDLRFDDHDTFRYGVRQVRASPGRELIKTLGLVRQSGFGTTWVRKNTVEPALTYEAWDDEPPLEEDHYRSSIRSDGWRIWARADVIQSFLKKTGWDLICEVQIERRLRKEYSRSYESDAKRKTHEKILLLTADGSIEDASGPLGPWPDARGGTGAGARRGHARQVDVPSHRRADSRRRQSP